jgi:hypothetical protein
MLRVGEGEAEKLITLSLVPRCCGAGRLFSPWDEAWMAEAGIGEGIKFVIKCCLPFPTDRITSVPDTFLPKS